MIESSTDCRTETGITVGLIDSLITICRILRQRDLMTNEVQEALKDLMADEDFNYLFVVGHSSSIKVTPEYIASTFKAIRVSAKMTQPQMAKILGCSLSAVSQYENGNRKIPIEIWVKMGEHFGFEACLRLEKRESEF